MAKRLKHKDINFLQVLHERPEGQQGPGKKRALIALPIVLAIAVALAYGGLAFPLLPHGARLSPGLAPPFWHKEERGFFVFLFSHIS